MQHVSNVHTMTQTQISFQANSTADSTINTANERSNTKIALIDYDKTVTQRGYMSIPKVYGMSKKQFIADDGFSAEIAANPAKMAYLVIYWNARAAAVDVNTLCLLKYHVEFYDRVQIGGS